MRRLCSLCLLILTGLASAQDGGGPLPAMQLHDEISADQRARIDRMLMENAEALRGSGLLAEPTDMPAQTGLQWPLHPVASYTDPGYHGVGNFVDLNNASGQLLDWNCGQRTYDGHAGDDLFLTPFPWIMMDNGDIDIVAAAAGTIIGRQDGFDDRSCLNNYSADWNAVYVRHADGSVAWYGHMKKGSLTAKAVGSGVVTGEFLGKVGSSGFSTGPHLHFENHTTVSNYQVVDAYGAGVQGQLTCPLAGTLWASQPPYYDSAITKLATHSAAPSFNAGCPNPGEETPNFKNAFQPGDKLTIAAYYRDQMAGQSSQVSILRPDGSAFASFSFSKAMYYTASYWIWNYTLPAAAPSGVWRFRVTFQGVTNEHRFTVGDVMFADGFE
jgi:hypothetical protein